MAPSGAAATSPWAPSRRRAETLRERHPFAKEVLTLYLALLDVWEEAREAALEESPEAGTLAKWAAGRVLPRVVAATARAGPQPLAEAAHKFAGEGAASEALVAWLEGAEVAPVGRYLARACTRGPLEVLDAGAACAEDPSPRGDRRCPRCGGPPQLSFRLDSADGLVSGRRRLACARCGTGWSYSGSACASCGETTGSRRTVYAERREGPVVGRGPATGVAGAEAEAGAEAASAGAGDAAARDGGPLFPHLRIESCERCKRYLIDVDLGRDARAVPEVDELAALPLDLYAAERGLSKITPNLMGF